MSKKHIALTVLVVIAVAALSVAAVVKYHNRPKTVPQPTVAQALAAEKNALNQVNVRDAALKQNEQTITTLQSQKTAACAALTAHKLVSPACQ